MTKISKTIVFFGTDSFSLATLSALYENGYHISAVVTKPDAKSGRGQKLTQTPVKKYAEAHNIPVWQPEKVSEINEQIISLGPDIIGILVVFGKIIPQSTIDLFPDGIINIHPSLLPLYRGPSPIESAILNDDKKTGISIMKIDSGMDSGPVYSQIDYELNGTETRPELYNKFATIGSDMLIKILPSIIERSLISTPQNNSRAVYCNLLSKADGLLNPTTTSAKRADCMVRAFLTYPKTKVAINSNIITITKAHISSYPNEKSPQLSLKCCDDNFLIIDELIAPSGKTMSAESYTNGYL